MSDDCRVPGLVIVGGGLTGAALAIQCLNQAAAPLDIAIVEPADEIGRGIAYGTVDPVHRINVPTPRMSLCPGRPDDFTTWLVDRGLLPDPASTDANGEHYVSRAAFGTYAAETLATAGVAAGPGITFRHVKGRVAAIAQQGRAWIVRLEDGRSLAAEGVALCPGHPKPVLPCRVAPAALAHPGFVANPWGRDAYANIGRDASVLIVGTGLTMLDALASLERGGHRGPILAISRRGLMARPQGGFRDGFDPFADAPEPRTALDLLRLARDGVAASADAGWQEVLDAFRSRLKRLWAALPASEQRRVVRKLLPYWDVHRFRAAPQLHALAEVLRVGGRLLVRRAGLAGLDAAGCGLDATLKRPDGETEVRRFDAVVLCTGPGNALRTDPLVGGLVADGLARPDGVGLGLAVDPDSRILRPGGGVHETLWAFGPVTRGSFGEMTGAPDIVRHVAGATATVLRAVAPRRTDHAARRRLAG